MQEENEKAPERSSRAGFRVVEISGIEPLFFCLPEGAQKKHRNMSYGAWVTFGGDTEARTPDLLNAIQALSQLSYTPKRQILYYRKKMLLSSKKSS